MDMRNDLPEGVVPAGDVAADIITWLRVNVRIRELGGAVRPFEVSDRQERMLRKLARQRRS